MLHDRWSKKFDPRVVGTRLDLGGKGFVSHPVNQTGAFRPRNRVCATILYMHEIFQYFISFIGSVGAKIVFVTREGEPVALTSTLRPAGPSERNYREFSGNGERILPEQRVNTHVYVCIIKYCSKTMENKEGFGLEIFSLRRLIIPCPGGQFL